MRGRKAKQKTESALLSALNFVACAQRSIGAPEQTHCRFFYKWVCASNGIISAAHKTADDMSIAPHTMTLIDALEQAPDAIAITTNENTISVKSGLFEATIDCVEPDSLPKIWPDSPDNLCDNRLQKALDTVGILVSDGATKVVNASVQLCNGSVLATNGSVILEAWHGIPMQPIMIAPKLFVSALKKASSKAIYRFGQSENTFTVWYDDESWIKTQLYPSATEIPDVKKYLNIASTPVPVPIEMFHAAKRLQKFSEDGRISFTGDGARVTNTSKMTHAMDAINGVPAGISFSINDLLTIAPLVQTIHFNAAPGITLFFGDNVRGAVVNQNGEI